VLGQWIKTARNDISPEVIVRGFKKCCVSNDMNGTDDDVLQRKIMMKAFFQ
jgi:hypothetical protein